MSGQNKTIVAVGGVAYHKGIVQNILKESDEFTPCEFDDLDKADVGYWLYATELPLKAYIKFWKPRPRLIIHWMGTDILDYNADEPNLSRRYLKRLKKLFYRIQCRSGRIINLAFAPWLVEELTAAGIKSRFFYVTSLDVKNMRDPDSYDKKDFDFMSYVPLRRFRFYGGEKILEAARKLRDYRFLIIQPDVPDQDSAQMNRQRPGAPENVTFLPGSTFDQMQRYYLRSKCFLRFTEHDTVSLSVLEALFFKLQVFWTYRFPHTYHIEDFGALHEDMARAIENWKPNDAGHDYVVQNFALDDAYRQRFRDLIKEAAGI